MSRSRISSFVALLVALCSHSNAAEPKLQASKQWAQWRGPLATGFAPDADPPVNWSNEKGVRWKVKIPGRGHSTPIVWGNHIFLLASTPVGKAMPPKFSGAPGAHDNLPITHQHKFVVICVDRRFGKIVWTTPVATKLPHEGAHNSASLASASPVTDGERVYASFGSYGVYCLNFKGKILWKKDLGKMNTRHGHGEGTSPVLHNDKLIVNWDHEGKSFVVAFDKKTGKQRWRVDREEVTSWASPIIVNHKGKVQLIISGTNRVRGYDVETGKSIWACGGMSRNIVASPVAGNGMVYAGSSYDKQAMVAIRLDGAQGDITGTKQVAWSRIRGTPYVPSPLLVNKSLYFLRHYQAIFTRAHAVTGKDEGTFRLGPIGNIYASPVAAADRIYVTDRRGNTMVLSHTNYGKVLGFNRLGEEVNASLALVDNDLLIRGTTHLYCISKP